MLLMALSVVPIFEPISFANIPAINVILNATGCDNAFTLINSRRIFLIQNVVLNPKNLGITIVLKVLSLIPPFEVTSFVNIENVILNATE